MDQSQHYGEKQFHIPEIWDKVITWAKRHAVVNDLTLIIDTCRLLDHETSGLGTVLQHLTPDRARNQLLVWADYHPACAGLYRLAEACYRDTTLF
ncbi:MAG: hypothetical protein DBP03_04920 [gamma proteobacterium symbiont of Ctena orbiculata]|nr:MAG: hypothetical protein DBP03_04920 [gamma proteobacterium symbiont of Ctena orbiculata]